MPAAAAGPSFCGCGDQRALGRLQAEALGDLRRDRLDLHADPAARDGALVLERGDHVLGDFGGNGEADADVPPEGEKIAVLTPTTSPCALKVGPPELPRFTGASICRKSS